MKLPLVLAIAIVALSATLVQSKAIADSAVDEQIIALEKAGWNAWKNKDKRWFERNTMKEAMWVSADGITDKAQYLKELPTGCEIKSVSLANFKFGMKTPDSVIMTYTANQDGTCGGKAVPATVRASVVYVKRGGKWREALYMETPAAQ
ncbi:MAG: nuclear transport factor 2 family protein [Betaproteobacteria bacterium]